MSQRINTTGQSQSDEVDVDGDDEDNDEPLDQHDIIGSLTKDQGEEDEQRTYERYLRCMIANSYFPDDQSVEISNFNVERAIHEGVQQREKMLQTM